MFYYNYHSLKKVHLDEWDENFFWPVKRETTTQITLDFKAEQTRIINELGYTFEGDCFLIGHLISAKYIEVLNHYACIDRLRSLDYSIHMDDKLRLIPLLLSEGSITFDYGNMWKLKADLKTHLRNIRTCIPFNFKKGNYNIFQHFSENKTHAYPSSNVLNREYTTHLKDWISIVSSGYYFDQVSIPGLSHETSNRFKDLAHYYTNFAASYSEEKLNVKLPENIISALRDFTFEYLCHISEVYKTINENVKKAKIRKLLTPTAGSPYVRTLSLSVRNNSGKVSGFPHGYYICHYSSPRPALHELATVDEFVAYTDPSRDLIIRNMQINPVPRNNPVKIISENTPFFKNLWEKWKSRKLPEKIKTVMLLELNFEAEIASYYVPHVMVSYNFYYNLCKFLSSEGYNVIFKRRPKDQSWEGFNIFADIPNVKIIYEHFEAPGVIEMADAVIVQYAMSSTMYWSMCTNKTVIYANAGWDPWFPEVYKSMEKRCRILNCSYDERNRAVFDGQELLDILSKKPEQPNTEFMERYLFPR